MVGTGCGGGSFLGSPVFSWLLVKGVSDYGLSELKGPLALGN